jgi:ketopantoate reductase
MRGLSVLASTSVACVIVALKVPQLVHLLPMVVQHCRPGLPVILPQNGLLKWSFPAFSNVPIHHVIADVSVGLERPGHAVLHSMGGFLSHVSLLDGMSRDLAIPMQSLGFRGVSAHEFWVAQRVKFLRSTTGARMAVENLSIGQAFASERVRMDLAAIVKEGTHVLVAAMSDCKLSRDLSDAASRLISPVRDGLPAARDHAPLDQAFTSLHRDLLRHRYPTEVQWLNGYISDLGRKLCIPTPLNDCLLEIVQRMEELGQTPFDVAGDNSIGSRMKQVFAAHHAQRLADATSV